MQKIHQFFIEAFYQILRVQHKYYKFIVSFQFLNYHIHSNLLQSTLAIQFLSNFIINMQKMEQSHPPTKLTFHNFYK